MQEGLVQLDIGSGDITTCDQEKNYDLLWSSREHAVVYSSRRKFLSTATVFVNDSIIY